MAARKNRKNSLVANINARRRAGKSRPKSRSHVSTEAYAAMEAGWPAARKKATAKRKTPKRATAKKTPTRAAAKKTPKRAAAKKPPKRATAKRAAAKKTSKRAMAKKTPKRAAAKRAR